MKVAPFEHEISVYPVKQRNKANYIVCDSRWLKRQTVYWWTREAEQNPLKHRGTEDAEEFAKIAEIESKTLPRMNTDRTDFVRQFC
jgi:hypothetical protein